jgi:hypothetical protein
MIFVYPDHEYLLKVNINDILFARGFGGSTDLSVCPDGYLYLISIGQEKYSESCQSNVFLFFLQLNIVASCARFNIN